MQKGTPISDGIGSYRVIQQLSVMGSVQVHLAREEGAGNFARNVVLKIVPKAAGGETRAVERFIHEAKASAKLTHPGIVRTRKVFEHDGAVVLVLEHVDGISLADLLARGDASNRRLPDDTALHIGVSICEALAHAHAMLDDKRASCPIVHRAVNPSNILIARDGLVKLDGFGFAETLGGVATDPRHGSTWTPAYLAPEQVTGQSPTPKVDLYAAALVIWELLTGRPCTILPNDPLAIEATLKAVAERKPDSLAALRPDLPRHITSGVDSALVSTPENRATDCAELARALRKGLHFAQGKLELRERVHAALAMERQNSQKVEPTKAPGAGRKAVKAPTAGAPARHQTLVGIAPPVAPPRLAGDSAAMRAATAPIGRPAEPSPPVPSAASAVAPAFPVRAGSSAGVNPFGATMPLPLPVVPRLPAVAPDLDTDVPSGVSGKLASAPLVPSDSALVVPVTDTSLVSGAQDGEPAVEQAPPRFRRWSALFDRLHAPTPWRRSPWLVAWAGLLLSLLALVGKLSFFRAPIMAKAPSSPPALATTSVTQTATATSGTNAQATPTLDVAAPLAPQPSADPIPKTDPEPARAEESAPSTVVLREEPAPKAMDATALTTDIDRALLRRGLGYLIVHSSAARANVYVNLRPYGSLEEKLSVPCGKQFISIGIPGRPRAKPVWLAPGKSMIIPCGGAFEATMNPRALR